jgi:hypothetical protein
LAIDLPGDCPNPKVILRLRIALNAHLQLPAILDLVQAAAGSVPHDLGVGLHFMKRVEVRFQQMANP